MTTQVPPKPPAENFSLCDFIWILLTCKDMSRMESGDQRNEKRHFKCTEQLLKMPFSSTPLASLIEWFKIAYFVSMPSCCCLAMHSSFFCWEIKLSEPEKPMKKPSNLCPAGALFKSSPICLCHFCLFCSKFSAGVVPLATYLYVLLLSEVVLSLGLLEEGKAQNIV